MICSEMNGKKTGNAVFMIKGAAKQSCSFSLEPGLAGRVSCPTSWVALRVVFHPQLHPEPPEAARMLRGTQKGLPRLLF